ncbi:tRNA (cytidine(34)-2'-O)-methyltransferase [Mycoplasmatota bacterium]|nr:tRNA (cytidine(34)-2'-O)-methyltransferase [Mycoplasmatota bacterium]
MPIHVVLYSPEIPQNTGNIMRTCAATNAKLHLIEPLGFRMDEKYIKRSSASNIDNVDYTIYIDWEEFKTKNKGVYVFLTRYGKKPPSNHDFSDVNENIYLIFGRESTGIPKMILKDYLDTCYRLPMASNIRSLNLSNTVAIMVYEVLRQQDYFGLSRVEKIKGENFIFD